MVMQRAINNRLNKIILKLEQYYKDITDTEVIIRDKDNLNKNTKEYQYKNKRYIYIDVVDNSHLESAMYDNDN